MNRLPGSFPGPDPVAQMREDIRQAHAQFQQQINALNARVDGHAGHVRGQLESQHRTIGQSLGDLAKVGEALRSTRSGGDYDIRTWWPKNQNVRVEDLPGRRVPYVLMVDIPIMSNSTSVSEASVTISQEGPFVAVRRMATFQSALQFRVIERDDTTATFAGRSFGRYRPIHSAFDLNDAAASLFGPTNIGPDFLGGNNAPALMSLPSNASGFRTMEFDGRIAVVNAGSSYPRQNLDIGVPTSMWTSQINSPQDLGALDFFERGEVITVKVMPGHVNNPPAGNVTGNEIFGPIPGVASTWPFLQGQYDPHEGIMTPDAFVTTLEPPSRLGADPVTRLPDGLLTVAWEGYRIIQPVGPGR
jgi:hypothetical protein